MLNILVAAFIGITVFCIALVFKKSRKRSANSSTNQTPNQTPEMTSQPPAMPPVRVPIRTETADPLPLYAPRLPLPNSYSNLQPLETTVTSQETFSTPPTYTEAIEATEPQPNSIDCSGSPSSTEAPLATVITIPATAYHPVNVPESQLVSAAV
ncbi:hypothetical protein BGZ76_009941 [Entomortierella beljakovae]|nr:hypothetical protein BGZ76_009941 [Entomortierella beljakovae]